MGEKIIGQVNIEDDEGMIWIGFWSYWWMWGVVSTIEAIIICNFINIWLSPEPWMKIITPSFRSRRSTHPPHTTKVLQNTSPSTHPAWLPPTPKSRLLLLGRNGNRVRITRMSPKKFPRTIPTWGKPSMLEPIPNSRKNLPNIKSIPMTKTTPTLSTPILLSDRLSTPPSLPRPHPSLLSQSPPHWKECIGRRTRQRFRKRSWRIGRARTARRFRTTCRCSRSSRMNLKRQRRSARRSRSWRRIEESVWKPRKNKTSPETNKNTLKHSARRTIMNAILPRMRKHPTMNASK